MDDVRQLAEADHDNHKVFFFKFSTNANIIYQSKCETYEIRSHWKTEVYVFSPSTFTPLWSYLEGLVGQAGLGGQGYMH